MQLESLLLSGQSCRYHIVDGPIFVMPVASFDDNHMNSVLSFLNKEYRISDISIFMYEVPGWDPNLQSHPANACSGIDSEDHFILKWFETVAVPYIRQKTDQSLVHIRGLLPGLPSMSLLSQSGLFQGFLTCFKTSLTLELLDCISVDNVQADCCVYMSLGIEKQMVKISGPGTPEEELLHHQQMRMVRNRHILDSFVRIMPDEDFNEPEELAQGIAWMLKHMRYDLNEEGTKHGEQTERQGKKH